MSRVFISYKRKDKDTVFPLVREIEEVIGEKCWIDLDGIETSVQFTSVLCRAIDNSEIVLFMHSRHHLDIDYEEDWTVKELNYARALKRRVVLIMIDDAPLRNLFLMEYGSKNNIDISVPEQKAKLFKDLCKWLNIPYREKQSPTKANVASSTVITDKITLDLDAEVDNYNRIVHGGVSNGRRYVDLGLSVKWAMCNVGAKYPHELGAYYAWGESEVLAFPQLGGSGRRFWSSYKFTMPVADKPQYLIQLSDVKLSKYNTDPQRGKVDNLTLLEPVDDVASIEWGGGWRMPTKEEMCELLEKCTWEWTERFGVGGYNVVSGVNGASIFLPAAGASLSLGTCPPGYVGDYWTRSLYSVPTTAYLLFFDRKQNELRVSHGQRVLGHTIRPVMP